MSFRAKKSFGQNFLTDQVIIQRIIAALDLKEIDKVFEVGPGKGALTFPLEEQASCLKAVELDKDAVNFLQGKLRSTTTVTQADILSIDWNSILGDHRQWKLATNLPYNISHDFCIKLLANRSYFEKIVMMVQKEVAERICCKELSSKDYGTLSVLMQSGFEAEYLFTVPPEAFSPQPKVESAVIQLKPLAVMNEESKFQNFVYWFFAKRRKKLLPRLQKEKVSFYACLTEVEKEHYANARAEEFSTAKIKEIFFRKTN